MAEMLVRLVDKNNHDNPVKHAQLTKRGDVIVIMDDGHPWSPAELAGDPWRVVKVPGVPIADLSAYLAEEPHDAANPHHLRQRRAFAFDIDKHDGKDLTRDKSLAMKLKKPPTLDPNVL
jgi:hypothetical protein